MKPFSYRVLLSALCIFVLNLALGVVPEAHAVNPDPQTLLKTDLPLAYLEKTSGDSKGKPLFIFLHGYGSNAQDLFELKADLPTDVTVLSAQATTAQSQPGRFEWFSVKVVGGEFSTDPKEVYAATALVKDFVAKAIAKYKTSANKTVLIGFSQGAIMAYEMGLRNPKAVKAIVALSGRMTPMMVSYLKTKKKQKEPHVFIGHGTSDKTLTLTEALEAKKAIEETAIKPEFHSYTGLGHTVNEAEMKDVKKFLERIL